jgi:NodT family efflux transporter outer membrane factor (OMF) lipoprotein
MTTSLGKARRNTWADIVRKGCGLAKADVLAGLLMGGLAASLAGCAVGPDFQSPEAPVTDSYTSGKLPPETVAAPVAGGATQRFAFGKDIPGEWWRLYQSEPLDQLIRAALADSPTLAAAQATLRQAQDVLRGQSGALLFPGVDTHLAASRQKNSGASFGQPGASGNLFNLYNASVSVSYTVDAFGGVRRELEGYQAQVDFQRYQLEATYITLTANIVTAAVSEASLRGQIRLNQEILDAQEKQLKVVESQFELGGVSRSDVLIQQTQVAQTRALLPPLEKDLAQVRHQLAVYAGRLPSTGDLPEFGIDAFRLPEELPVTLPSELVRQRPDVRAAEALMHEASAQIGVATANLLPQITLGGTYGSEATRIGDLFGPGSLVWNLAAGLVQPVFRGGELRAARDATIAAYDAAAAQYEETVLQAFQNVADVLRALEVDARTLKARADAAEAARATLALTEQQFRLGSVNYLALLVAQRQYQLNQVSLVQAQAARYADSAALFLALGGGWWNRPEAAGADANTR